MNRRTRVLLLSSTNQRRGAELECFELASRLTAEGHLVSLAALAPGQGDALDIRVLSRRGSLFVASAKAWVLSRRHDVVAGYGSRTLWVMAFLSIGRGPVVVYRSIGDPSAWIRGALHRWRTSWAFRRMDTVVSISLETERSLVRQFGVQPHRVRRIPNARSSQFFTPAALVERERWRHDLAVPKDASVVAIVGALSEEKRCPLAIRSLAAIPNLVVLVAGDGPQRQECERISAELGVDVRFLGVVREARAVLGASDLLLLTSRTEGLPGVVIESLMCGVPVVATAVGALPELGVRGLCLVGVNATPDEIRTEVRRVLARRAEQPGRDEKILEFDWSRVLPQWADCLDTLNGGRSSV